MHWVSSRRASRWLVQTALLLAGVLGACAEGAPVEPVAAPSLEQASGNTLIPRARRTDKCRDKGKAKATDPEERTEHTAPVAIANWRLEPWHFVDEGQPGGIVVEYRAMIASVRRAASIGRPILDSSAHATRNDYTEVIRLDIDVHGAAPGQIQLFLQANDLYVMGWRVVADGREGQTYQLRDNDSAGRHDLAGLLCGHTTPVPFGMHYHSLEETARGSAFNARLNINRLTLEQAATNLLRFNPARPVDVAGAASAILTFATAVAEAARFPLIAEHVAENVAEPSGQRPLQGLEVALITDWDDLSRLATGRRVDPITLRGVNIIVRTATAALAYLALVHAEPHKRIGPRDIHESLGGVDLRVMPVGDSITFGMGSSHGGGYRRQLLATLKARAKSVDFVGSRADGNLEDRNHEGYPGDEIAKVAQLVRGSWGRFRPNVVTLHLGTNDMVREIDVGGAPARLSRMLDEIYAGSPGVFVVVSTLVPASDPALQARIMRFNDGVREVVERFWDAGKKIEVVEPSEMTTDDLADGVHPNDAGYVALATAFARGIAHAASVGRIAPPGPSLNADCAARGGWEPRLQFARGVPQGGGLNANLTGGRLVQFADVDGDKKADYLVVGGGGSVTAYLNKGGDAGGGGWQYRGELALGAGVFPEQVRFADVDGNGRADYLAVHDGGRVDAYLNRGGDRIDLSGNWQAGWEPWPQFARGGTGARVGDIEFADLDADGKADYLALRSASGALDAFMNRGGDRPGFNGWEVRAQYAGGAVAAGQRALFAQFDCDGRADYLTVDRNGALVTFLNEGGDRPGVNGWRPIGTTAPGTNRSTVQFADVDGDGRDDYLVLAPNGAMDAYLNRGGDPAR